jgi:hypothetical protein
VLLDWSREVSSALGLDSTSATTPDGEGLNVDEKVIDDVLALARDAAHAVERPAAPLTTFLVGYAAGLRGGGVSSVSECVAVVQSLARSWREGAPRRTADTGISGDRGAS